MEMLVAAMRQMISLSDAELAAFLDFCSQRSYARNASLSEPGRTCEEVFFVSRGMVRVTITDLEGQVHTLHFAMEGQFIADYASFLTQTPSIYTLQAVEAAEVAVLPRTAIEWGYQNLAEGDRLGRIIAESYFIYHDNRIKDLYAKSPRQRYDSLSQVFPNIHNRVPQHMIASYLGITPVHLSRLKKQDR